MKTVNSKILTLIFLAMAIFALSGCGSSGTSSNDELVGGTEGKPQVGESYVIEAHQGSTAIVHSHVTPSPTDEHAHEWTQVSGPTVALTTPTEQTTTFVVPHATTEPVVLKHTVTNVERSNATETHHVVVPIPTPTQVPTPPQVPTPTPPQVPTPTPPQVPTPTPPATPWNVVVSTHVSVEAGKPASLHASVSNGSGPYTYFWTQTGGPPVTLDPTLPSAPTFTAPSVTKTEDLIFEVLVTNTQDNTTARATETITVTVPKVPFSVTPIEISPSSINPANVRSDVHYTLHVTASGGSGSYGYTWYENNTQIATTRAISIHHHVACVEWIDAYKTPHHPHYRAAYCKTPGIQNFVYRVEVTDGKATPITTPDYIVNVMGDSRL